MADDNWKGEHLIRTVTDAQRKSEVRRIVNKIAHANRRKKGIPPAGAKKHSAFVKVAVYRTHKGSTDA